MKKLLPFFFVFLLALVSINAQINPLNENIERKANLLSNKKLAAEKLFLLDSIHAYNSRGEFTAREYNYYNENHLHIASFASAVDYNGVENNLGIDSSFYDNNQNLQLYKYYEWQDGEWVGSTSTEYFRDNDGKKDSVKDMRFDKDLAEWIISRKEYYTYDNEGSVVEMLVFSSGRNGELRRDFRNEYSDFIDIDKPQKISSWMYNDEGVEHPYMNTYNEYDNNKRNISTINKIVEEKGERISSKKEMFYNEKDQLTEIIEYYVPYGTQEFQLDRKTKNVYNTEYDYLEKDSNFWYSAYQGGWSLSSEMIYFWNEVVPVSVKDVTQVEISAYYNSQNKQLYINSDEKINNIMIYDIEGKPIKKSVIISSDSKQSHVNQYSVPLNNVRAGIYIIQLSTSNTTYNKKIFIHE